MLRVRPAAAVVATAMALGALSGCGSDDAGKGEGKDADPSPSATSSTPAPYLEVPEGVILTEPGTVLQLGEEATVAFERRQGEVDVLTLTVERIERTSFEKSFAGWRLDDAVAARTPYFVRVKVTNADDADLGGRKLEGVLWANDGTTLEAPNSYSAKSLPACAGGALPTSFPPGESAELCEVFFIAPSGPLENLLFQPYGGLEPITWSGEVSKVSDPSRKKDKKSGAEKSDKKKSGKKKPDTSKPGKNERGKKPSEKASE